MRKKQDIKFEKPKKCAVLFPVKFERGISYSRRDREVVEREMQLYHEGRIR